MIVSNLIRYYHIYYLLAGFARFARRGRLAAGGRLASTLTIASLTAEGALFSKSHLATRSVTAGGSTLSTASGGFDALTVSAFSRGSGLLGATTGFTSHWHDIHL
uniref:Uncharacterized protein n=1 Tax=viral metagenome TaxID=1070528 RepID=A0A6C0LIS9_9ZZZZ